MDGTLIKNWNALVKPEDTVYHLGDFSFHRNVKSEGIMWRLNGKIHFIYGNHDKKRNMPQHNDQKFIHLGHYHELHVQDKEAKGGSQLIVLTHYAFRVWNKSHHGSFSLYGHSHGSLPDDPNSKSFDVGVDCHDYKPVSYEQVKAIMSKKNFTPIDHHGAK